MKAMKILLIVLVACIIGVLVIIRPSVLNKWMTYLNLPEISYRESESYTCNLCGSSKETESTRYFKYISIENTCNFTYKAAGFASCSHNWTTGRSKAIPATIPDGTIILVKKDGKYGAFILQNQTMSPEQAEFTWWYLNDGTGHFKKGNPNLKTGKASTTHSGINIMFASFNIEWSIGKNGSGWLYYDHFTGDKVKPTDLHICVTNLKSIEGVDATDKKWEYKATPAY